MNPALRRSAAHVFVESLAAPVLEPGDLHHLLRVLRLRAGEVVSVADGLGAWRLCRIGVDGDLAVDGEIIDEPSRPRPLTVAFAIPKGDRPEWIVQKLTEIGIDRIIALHTDRGVVRWDASKVHRHLPRLANVVREAAMQSRRVRLPELVGPLTPAEVFAERLGGASASALADPDGTEIDNATATILIGPEGGWSDTELAMSPRRVSLGATVLRVETAAVVAAVRLTIGPVAG